VTDSENLNYDQVDCDSHVQEGSGSWENYLDPAYADRRPVLIDNPHVPGRPQRNKTWYFNGQLVPKNQGNAGVVMSTPVEMEFARNKPVPPAVQACTDPLARAKASLDAGIRRTVLFTTLFLQSFTDDVGYEAALMRSWNRWMSDMCSAAPDTLAFGALIPMRDPGLAAAEVGRAKELGAASVMILPSAGELLLHDPRVDRFWAACAEHDMPVSIHIGWPQPWVTNTCTTPSSVFLGAFDTSMWWAYLSVLTGGIFGRFPGLRISFLENDSRIFEVFLARAMHWYPTSAASPWPSKESPLDVLRNNQVYFSFEGDYALLPRFLDLVGEDRVMTALDFPHTHYGTASLSAAFNFVRHHEDLTPKRKRLVLRDNSVRFYGWQDFGGTAASEQAPHEVAAS
jgi:uncharacterized protein